MEKKEKKRSKSRRNIILFLLLFLIAFVYWFVIRPSNIRSECAKSVKEGALDLSYLRDPQAKRPEEVREMGYFECLREHGMEAPSK